jgi:hypothetical protein
MESCNCGDVVWCYRCGYKVKPSTVRQFRNNTSSTVPNVVGDVTASPSEGVTDSKGLSESVTKLQPVQNQQDADSTKKTVGRRRKFATAAERQKAYRQRKAAEGAL